MWEAAGASQAAARVTGLLLAGWVSLSGIVHVSEPPGERNQNPPNSQHAPRLAMVLTGALGIAVIVYYKVNEAGSVGREKDPNLPDSFSVATLKMTTNVTA